MSFICLVHSDLTLVQVQCMATSIINYIFVTILERSEVPVVGGRIQFNRHAQTCRHNLIILLRPVIVREYATVG